jgi:hypothetical protein
MLAALPLGGADWRTSKQVTNLPNIVIVTSDQYEAVIKEIDALADAASGSNEARLREALRLAAEEWWNARRRRAH